MAYEEARESLVDRLVERGDVERESTAAALRSVPRHEFVPERRRDAAYADRPLPIGEGQTISAPHMVGWMLDLLEVDAGDEVLEVGTGCGYHAACVAEVVGDGNVYSVEYVAELAETARERLADLGYEVEVRVGDGRKGWPEHAPYDAAYLTCAAPEFPEPVVDQTRPEGWVVAPVGTAHQRLVRLRPGNGGVDRERETFGAVRFVRMQG